MNRVVSATDARVRFGEMMQYLSHTQEPIIVEKSGHPQMVMLSIDHYRRLQNKLDSSFFQAASWVERVQQTRKLISSELGKKKLPNKAELIRNMREERDAQLLDLS